MTGRIPAAAIAQALGQFPPTEEQRAVIESPLDPALVIAGAGSGKTETMAGRVVWLVANGLVRRDQVLGLTFTRKAAGELAGRIQRRLARLAEFERLGLLRRLPELADRGALAVFGQAEALGDNDLRRRALEALGDRFGDPGERSRPVADDLLDRAEVSTYNSFADAIVREHAVRIGRDPGAGILTESSAWLLMRSVVLAADDPDLAERDASITTIVDTALRVAQAANDNLADLAAVDEYAARFQRVLEVPSESARVDVYAEIRRAAANVAALPVFTRLARSYAQRKRELGLIDFSDQVAGALDAVRRHPDVGEQLRDRARVVLLDEYQDTSVAQSELLAEIFRGRPVMAVGDPNQAIYGWRGASAGNLGGFRAAFGPTTTRVYSLRTSWRNSIRILDAARSIAEPLRAGGAVDVGTLAAAPTAGAGRVDVCIAADVEEEAERVAAWFDERGADGRRIDESGAVLFRTKRHMALFAGALAARGVPHRVLGLGGLLQAPEVVDVVSALRVIADPHAGSALIRLLTGPRWRVGLPDLAALNGYARRATAADGDRGSIVDALELLANGRERSLVGCSEEGFRRLREAGAVFSGLRRAASVPLPELIRLIVSELRLDIEVAVNEARGPMRRADANLHEFLDQVQAFLSADERGTLPSLLAWLEHAEHADDLAPRPEPAEPGVIQLLTIHGSKGLEWDAVAVVRMVEGELPTASRDGQGWLATGTLPYEFRGDADWLPRFGWEAAATQQELETERKRFREAIAQRHGEEERRLAYVAVTRARNRLLLSASPWAGTTRPRDLSRYVREAAAAAGVDLREPETPAEAPEHGERVVEWPLDPLGSRRARVEDAAALVRSAMSAERAQPDPELRLLLAERSRRGTDRVSAPVRIPASRYKDFVKDYDAASWAVARPMPERPFAQTQLGVRFHEWVEHRSGLSGTAATLDEPLWEEDTAGGAADADLSGLIDAFERSEWAPLRPIEVETEIDFRHTGLDGREHVVICKLDAVYRRGDRIEIVDWKTGAPPRNDAEREERMLQLELYRQAYHQRHGVPVEQIDVVLFYVAAGIVLRG